MLPYLRIMWTLLVVIVLGYFLTLLFLTSDIKFQSNPSKENFEHYARVRYSRNGGNDANEILEEVNFDSHEHAHEDDSLAKFLNKEVRILCWIMTHPENHVSKAIHVKKTWGQRCNKLIFMSSTEDKELGSIALPVSEGRESLWNKTKEAFKYIYTHHLDDADWFFKADDDTYAVVENLRYLLYPYSPDTAIYFGCKFKPFVKQGYMSGGAGYVLSKEALRRVGPELLNTESFCNKNPEFNEDVHMGTCLEALDVYAGDSRDNFERGTFFPFPPQDHLIPNLQEDWYLNYSYYPPNIVSNKKQYKYSKIRF